MENETQDVISMPDDSFESFASDLNEDGATAEIEKMRTASLKDPTHPYLNTGNSAAHKKAVARMSRLYEQKHQFASDGKQYNSDGEELVGTVSPEMQKMSDEAFARLATKQSKLVDAAQKEMDQLVELGFIENDVPADIQPWQIELLKAQRLNAEGTSESLTELSQLLTREAQSLRAEPELAEAVRHLNEARATLGKHVPEEFQEICSSVISIINKANKKKYGK